ncbi:hypothetical protein PoB_000238900 [Plakobranchus ocellatus]|uniref:Uncharacterized protein n=1 Tax=Plakobranchus ocellatus TaxID=259542 RepID=A0AAV3XYG0_9GAST|nr:hypothetical protein PoB_000238900 [Plakobranchus ocellatus]
MFRITHQADLNSSQNDTTLHHGSSRGRCEPHRRLFPSGELEWKQQQNVKDWAIDDDEVFCNVNALKQDHQHHLEQPKGQVFYGPQTQGSNDLSRYSYPTQQGIFSLNVKQVPNANLTPHPWSLSMCDSQYKQHDISNSPVSNRTPLIDQQSRKTVTSRPFLDCQLFDYKVQPNPFSPRDHYQPTSPASSGHHLTSRKEYRPSPTTPDEGYSTGTNSTTSISSPLSASLASISVLDAHFNQHAANSHCSNQVAGATSPSYNAYDRACVSDVSATYPNYRTTYGQSCRFASPNSSSDFCPEATDIKYKTIPGAGSSIAVPSSLTSSPLSNMQRGPIQKGPSLLHYGRKTIGNVTAPCVKRRDVSNASFKDTSFTASNGNTANDGSFSGHSMSSLEERLRALTTIEEEDTTTLDRHCQLQVNSSRKHSEPQQSPLALEQTNTDKYGLTRNFNKDIQVRQLQNHESEFENQRLLGRHSPDAKRETDFVEASGFFRAVPIQIVQSAVDANITMDNAVLAIQNRMQDNADYSCERFHNPPQQHVNSSPGSASARSRFEPTRSGNSDSRKLPAVVDSSPFNSLEHEQQNGVDRKDGWINYQEYFQKEVDIPAHNIDTSRKGKYSNIKCDAIPDMDINHHLQAKDRKVSSEKENPPLSRNYQRIENTRSDGTQTNDESNFHNNVQFGLSHIGDSIVTVQPHQRETTDTCMSPNPSAGGADPPVLAYSRNPGSKFPLRNETFSNDSLSQPQHTISETIRPVIDAQNVTYHRQAFSEDSKQISENVFCQIPPQNRELLQEQHGLQQNPYSNHDLNSPHVQLTSSHANLYQESHEQPVYHQMHSYIQFPQNSQTKNQYDSTSNQELQQQNSLSRTHDTLPANTLTSMGHAHISQILPQHHRQQQQQFQQQQIQNDGVHPLQGFSELQHGYDSQLSLHNLAYPPDEEPVTLRRPHGKPSGRAQSSHADRYSWQPGNTSSRQMLDNVPSLLHRSSLDLGNISNLQKQIRATSELCLQASRRHMFASSADIYKLFSTHRPRPGSSLASPASSPAFNHKPVTSVDGTTAHVASSINSDFRRDNNTFRYSFHSTSTQSLLESARMKKRMSPFLDSGYAFPDKGVSSGSSANNFFDEHVNHTYSSPHFSSLYNPLLNDTQRQQGTAYPSVPVRGDHSIGTLKQDLDRAPSQSLVTNDKYPFSQIEAYSPSEHRSHISLEQKTENMLDANKLIISSQLQNAGSKILQNFHIRPPSVELQIPALQRQSSGYSSETELQQIEYNAKEVKKQYHHSRKQAQQKRPLPQPPNPMQEFIALNVSAEHDSTTTAGTEDSTTDDFVPIDLGLRKSTSAEPVYMNQLMMGAQWNEKEDKTNMENIPQADRPPPLPQRRQRPASTTAAPNSLSTQQRPSEEMHSPANRPQHSLQAPLIFEGSTSEENKFYPKEIVNERSLQHNNDFRQNLNCHQETKNGSNSNHNSDRPVFTQNQVINFQNRPVTITSHIPISPLPQTHAPNRSAFDFTHSKNSSSNHDNISNISYTNTTHNTNSIPYTSNNNSSVLKPNFCNSPSHSTSASSYPDNHRVQKQRCSTKPSLVLVLPQRYEASQRMKDNVPPGSAAIVTPGAAASSPGSTSVPMSPLEIAQVLEVPFATNIISDEQGDRLSTLV